MTCAQNPSVIDWLPSGTLLRRLASREDVRMSEARYALQTLPRAMLPFENTVGRGTYWRVDEPGCLPLALDPPSLNESVDLFTSILYEFLFFIGTFG